MERHNVIETVIGALVLGVAGFFLVFAYDSADLGASSGGYAVTAVFPNIEGIKPGSDVRINGIKVGAVTEQELNPADFMASVKMEVARTINLPRDTVAVVANESLLGGRYIELEPGVEESLIARDGTGRITNTQPPLQLDDLIGRFVFNPNKSPPQKQDEAAEGADAAAAP